MAEAAPGRQAMTSPEVDDLFRIGKLKRAPAADEEIVGLPQSAEDRLMDAVPRQGNVAIPRRSSLTRPFRLLPVVMVRLLRERKRRSVFVVCELHRALDEAPDLLTLRPGHHCPDPPGRCRLPSPIGAEM